MILALAVFDKFKKGQVITEQEYKHLLNTANDCFHSSSKPIISDDEYDFLKKEFIEKYKYNPVALGSSKPLNKGFSKIDLEIPMGSLEEFDTKTDVIQEIYKWAKKYAEKDVFCASEKLDGLSVYCKYISGKLVQAVTRGDGFQGEDITNNVKKMMDIPSELPIPFNGFLRGEIILLKSRWQKYFPNYKNTRNGAAGLIKRLDGVGCEYLTIRFYKIYPKDINFKSETESLDYIANDLKLPTPKYFKTNINTIIALQKKYHDSLRAKLDYDIDGIVVNIDSIENQEKVNDDMLLPTASRKFKFESEQAITILNTVRNQVGRTGVVTPVAFVEPVVCGGVLISKITLHNYDEIERLKIRKGDKIKIVRSKDVIPKIVGVVEHDPDGFDIDIPERCPECDNLLIKKDALLYCTNPYCDARNLKSLLHWLTVLNIKHMGTKVVESLINAGKLNTVSDFYKLKVYDIASLERQGDRNAEKMLRELHDKKEIELSELLTGMNISHLGLKYAQILEDNFENLEKVFSLKEKDLLNLDGFDTKLANYIIEGLSQKKELIYDVLNYIKIKEKKKGLLTDKSFCFSGFRDNKLEQRIKDNGGRLASGVSKNLDFLIVRNKNGTTEKINKAKKYGTKILEPQDLEPMLLGINVLF